MGKILGKPHGKSYRVKGVSDPVWWDEYAKTDTRQALKRSLDHEVESALDEFAWFPPEYEDVIQVEIVESGPGAFVPYEDD